MKNRIVFFILGAVLATVAFFAGCASHFFLNALSEDSTYHFRKVRWGFSQKRIELAEAGSRMVKRTGDTLIYETKLNGVQCRLIYTFKDNKLRAAGYLSEIPIPNANNIIDKIDAKYGQPNTGDNGMIWKTSDTVIRAKVYESGRRSTITSHRYSPNGFLQGYILRRPEKRIEDAVVTYLDGVLAYFDKNFLDALDEVGFQLEELSFYEEQLMGVREADNGETFQNEFP